MHDVLLVGHAHALGQRTDGHVLNAHLAGHVEAPLQNMDKEAKVVTGNRDCITRAVVRWNCTAVSCGRGLRIPSIRQGMISGVRGSVFKPPNPRCCGRLGMVLTEQQGV